MYRKAAGADAPDCALRIDAKGRVVDKVFGNGFSKMLSVFLLLSLFGVTALVADAAEQPPEIPREFRGVWVATVYNLNWPSKAGLTVAHQKAELRSILDRAASLHLNAILLQVRPSSDALYESKIEPWSAFLSGKMGVAPTPAYDPLAWAIEEAHARGLELHAWFNPFRALTSTEASASPGHVTRRHPEWIRRYGGQLLLDPGEPAVREYVRGVILDVLDRYDVDGIHIDDYFYPYPVKDKAGAIMPFPDDLTWQRYLAGGGKLSRQDWRRDNVNQFVESTYRTVKAEKRWVKFGISPFGIWRPRVPETIEARLDAYEQLYADSRRWLQEGWCDYFTPQLYWPIDPAAQSFPVLYRWWSEQNRVGRHLWPGIATERIGPQRPAQEIIRQIEITRGAVPKSAGASAAVADPGQICWDMKSLIRDLGGIDALLCQKAYPERALVPASPWLGAQTPAAPSIARNSRGITWKPVGEIPARWWAVQVKTNGEWYLRVLPSGTENLALEEGTQTVAVRTIDRYGNAGQPAVVDFTGR
jgi:uncharacterized lipoprotein YddW (UPF0748 family)